MDIQRLRNMTTGRLHTNIGHIYEDIYTLTGSPGVMTHMMPNALRAMTPWLRQVAPDERLWDGEYDTSHTGEIDVPVMTEDERSEFFRRFGELPSPLAGEEVIVVEV